MSHCDLDIWRTYLKFTGLMHEALPIYKPSFAEFRWRHGAYAHCAVPNMMMSLHFIYTHKRAKRTYYVLIKKNATKISERSKGRIFLGSKRFWLKHLGKKRNLEQPEKFSLIARYLEIIPSKQLSGLHSQSISYIFAAHHLTVSCSFRRRIGELVPLVV